MEIIKFEHFIYSAAVYDNVTRSGNITPCI